MDNFHIEMRTTLEDVKTSQPTFKSEIIHQKFNILQEYFPNMFAEALIPINLRRWVSFLSGSVLSSDIPEFW